MRRVYFAVIALILLMVSSPGFALPFNIVPKAGTQLPTVVYTGKTATAYYTVSNETGTQRNNNFVNYLPPNVSQVTAGGTYADTCGSTFNLAAKGQSGSSCTLQLLVSGVVNSEDPDQTHHLFVCFPGGKTCAGTLYPLNVGEGGVTALSVTVTPVTAAIAVNQTQQYTATENFSDGTTTDVTHSATWTSSNPAAATISQTGLATAVTGGTTTMITANYAGLTSTPVTLTITRTLVSISLTDVSNTMLITRNQQLTVTGTYNDGSTANITSSATFSTTNPSAVTVSTGGVATAMARGTSSISASVSNPSFTSNSLSLNVVVTGYIGQYNGANNYTCTANVDGTLTGCTSTGATSVSSLFANSTYTTLLEGQTTNSRYCSINIDGTLGACTSIGKPAASVILNPANTYAYFQEYTPPNSTVVGCQYNSTTNSFTSCVNYQNSSFESTSGAAVSPNGNYYYVTEGDNFYAQPKAITVCSITNNLLSNCANTGVGVFPFAVAINKTGTFIYTGDYTTTGPVLSCALSPTTGAISACQSGGQNFSNILGLSVDPSGNYLYVATNGNGVYSCLLNNTTGLYSGCVAVTGISLGEAYAAIAL